jgi:hypothetical protein
VRGSAPFPSVPYFSVWPSTHTFHQGEAKNVLKRRLLVNNENSPAGYSHEV